MGEYSVWVHYVSVCSLPKNPPGELAVGEVCVSQGEAPGGAGCWWDQGIQDSCHTARGVWGLTETCLYGCVCAHVCRRQLGRVRTQDQLLDGSVLSMCIFKHIFPSQIFTLICQREEQGEAIGAAHVSAECFCLCGQWGHQCAHTYVCTCACACACWEFPHSLPAGWTQGHGAVAASPLTGEADLATPSQA